MVLKLELLNSLIFLKDNFSSLFQGSLMFGFMHLPWFFVELTFHFIFFQQIWYLIVLLFLFLIEATHFLIFSFTLIQKDIFIFQLLLSIV